MLKPVIIYCLLNQQILCRKYLNLRVIEPGVSKMTTLVDLRLSSAYAFLLEIEAKYLCILSEIEAKYSDLVA